MQLLSYDTTFQLGDFYVSPLADWNDTFLRHSDPSWIFAINLLLEDTYGYFALHFQSKVYAPKLQFRWQPSFQVFSKYISMDFGWM